MHHLHEKSTSYEVAGWRLIQKTTARSVMKKGSLRAQGLGPERYGPQDMSLIYVAIGGKGKTGGPHLRRG